jgi:anti-sigma factor RsiW
MATSHITGDDLELYAMERLPESDAAPVEKHLRVCDECRKRLAEWDCLPPGAAPCSNRALVETGCVAIGELVMFGREYTVCNPAWQAAASCSTRSSICQRGEGAGGGAGQISAWLMRGNSNSPRCW